MTGAGMDWTGIGACVTGIWLLELTGFGLSLSLEQPTVTEQMISTAAKMSALAFLPQATEWVCFMERTALMRVIVVASCRLAALEGMHDGVQGIVR